MFLFSLLLLLLFSFCSSFPFQFYWFQFCYWLSVRSEQNIALNRFASQLKIINTNSFLCCFCLIAAARCLLFTLFHLTSRSSTIAPQILKQYYYYIRFTTSFITMVEYSLKFTFFSLFVFLSFRLTYFVSCFFVICCFS